MPRPRKADSRDHQINLRFSAPEYVRVYANAAIMGSTVPDFARVVLLRRPRRRKRGIQPVVIALPDNQLEQWHVLGARLNDIAHVLNARDDLPPSDLVPLLVQIRAAFKKSFTALLGTDAKLTPY